MTIRDSLAPTISDGDQLNEGYFNENFNFLQETSHRTILLNSIRLVIEDQYIPDEQGDYVFVEGYVSDDGVLGTVQVGNTTASHSNNSYYYESDPSEIWHSLPFRYQKPLNKIYATALFQNFEPGNGVEFKLQSTLNNTAIVVVTADELEEDFNDFGVIVSRDGDNWILQVDPLLEASFEEQTNRIFSALFFGEEPRILEFTNVTNIQTNNPRYLGKKAVFARQFWSAPNNGTRSYTGTFNNTTDNDGTILISHSTLSGGGTGRSRRVEFPVGNILWERTSTQTVDERVQDTSSYDTDNPDDVMLRYTKSSGGLTVTHLIETLMFFNEGTISWSTSGTGAARLNVDFEEDHNLPNISSELLDSPDFEETSWLPINKLHDIDTIVPTEIGFRLIPRSANPLPEFPRILGVGYLGY